jgi:5-methylcytosine-specific restriction endonuclease McrA
LVPLTDWPVFKQSPLFRDHPWHWPVCQRTGVLLVGGKHSPNSAVIDHIKPHRGNLELFWDEDNLQAVSKEYHDKVKQSLEKQGLA